MKNTAKKGNRKLFFSIYLALNKRNGIITRYRLGQFSCPTQNPLINWTASPDATVCCTIRSSSKLIKVLTQWALAVDMPGRKFFFFLSLLRAVEGNAEFRTWLTSQFGRKRASFNFLSIRSGRWTVLAMTLSGGSRFAQGTGAAGGTVT